MKTDYFTGSCEWSLLDFLTFHQKENWTEDKRREHNTYTTVGA